MILALEIVMICIALFVFMMQHQIKQRMSIVGSKLVYWTTLLFASLGLNSILFALYPSSFYINTYINIQTLIIGVGIVLGYVLLQMIAPSRAIQKLLKKLGKKQIKEGEEETTIKNEEHNSYLKELHFETFLETICWLAFVFTLTLQVMNTFIGEIPLGAGLDASIKNIVCLMMMITVPIGMRQIIFYLYRIRGIREEQEMTEIEMKFHQKLKSNKNKL